MDIKEIIKWFIPCFHILLAIFVKMDKKLTFIFLILFFNCCPAFGANVSGKDVLSENFKAKDVGLVDENILRFNQSEEFKEKSFGEGDAEEKMDDTSVGRTFGRPFKKMMAALIPLVFQIGAASTWAVIAALVGVKTLAVTLLILKLLLMAGALKAGALLASKGHHQSHGWEPPHHPQKEVHLHIHNGHHEHEVHPQATWSRNEVDIGTKNYVLDPYTGQVNAQTLGMLGNNVRDPYMEMAGPQTISTPYGKYVKID